MVLDKKSIIQKTSEEITETIMDMTIVVNGEELKIKDLIKERDDEK